MKALESDDWTQVLEKELADTLQMQDDDPNRVETLSLDMEVIAQFVKFTIISWRGSGGGLQYFDIVRQ